MMAMKKIMWWSVDNDNGINDDFKDAGGNIIDRDEGFVNEVCV